MTALISAMDHWLDSGDVPEAVPPPVSVTPPRVLEPQVIELWRADLTGDATDAARLSTEVLSPDERARAERFRFPRDRTRFVFARAALRACLAHHLGGEPRAIRFRYGSAGKPVLADPAAGLFFNLSHAGDQALLAVTRAGEIGIDLEAVREMSDWAAIARTMFGSAAVTRLAALEPAPRMEAFFRYWTATEARMKSTGQGLGAEPPPSGPPVYTFTLPPDLIASVTVPAAVRVIDFRHGAGAPFVSFPPSMSRVAVSHRGLSSAAFL